MSYPAPPGLKTSNSSTTSAPQPHPSLPVRPPLPLTGPLKPASATTPAFANGAPGTGGFYLNGSQASPASSSFTAFKPRSVGGGSQDWRGQPASISAGPAPPSNFTAPTTTYSSGYQQPQPQYPYQQPAYYPQPSSDSFAQPTPPQIRNPFPLPGQEPLSGPGRGEGRGGFGNANYDPELEAQIAQWQSAYASKDDSTGQRGTSGPSSAGGANAIALGTRPAIATPLTSSEVASAAKADSGVAAVVAGPDGKQKTVVRSGGGKTWQDSSLLEWDPAHFRLFVGNLAGEVTDESLLKAFSKYDSVQKARVVRDKRTTKSQGYGFVSFSNGDQYFQAAKEMQGKYIGSHPVLLRRSTTEIRPTNPADKNKKGKGGKGSGNGGGNNTGAGVHKKQSKTKGGLKILG